LCEPLFNARQTGLDKQQAVQEKLALLACYREGINAHLTAAIAIAEERPSIRACGTRLRRNARAIGWKPTPPARIYPKSGS